METLGVYEAKTNLNKILDKVARGESFTITRHGVPVATLQPARPELTQSVEATVAAIKDFRRGRTLGGLTIKEMISEGRK